MSLGDLLESRSGPSQSTAGMGQTCQQCPGNADGALGNSHVPSNHQKCRSASGYTKSYHLLVSGGGWVLFPPPSGLKCQGEELKGQNVKCRAWLSGGRGESLSCI